VIIIKNLVLVFAEIIKVIYGYEAINLLLRITPSQVTIAILRFYGAKIGKGVRIKSPLIIHNADQNKRIYSNLTIGNDSYIGRDCFFDLLGKINIKSNVTISHRSIFNTHTNYGKSGIDREYTKGDIVIEKDSYLGCNVTVLESVNIGEKTLIGAGSLVNKSIPANVIAYGIPCKVERENK